MNELVDHLRHPQGREKLDRYLDGLLTRNLPVEHIYLRVFQPAARRLGELWAEDLCSFVDVTLAMALLQSGLRLLAPRFHRHGRSADGTRCVILAGVGGDQHTFGLAMAAEFFRRSGWTVLTAESENVADLASRIEGERKAVVGFSASRLDQLPLLATTIRRLRRSCGNRIAGILVGGPLIAAHPDCVAHIGDDAVGPDVRQALAAADHLLFAAGEGR